MKNKITCIIVDDEPKAIEQIEDLLTDLYNNVEIVGKFTSWKDAFETLKTTSIDIILLDIQMPGKTGIAMLKLLPALQGEIIFITADATYALEAYNLHASGYILKPIEDALFKANMDKAIERVWNKARASKHESITAGHDRIGVPNDEGIEYINVSEILYLEATAGYTKIKMTNMELLSSYSIGRFKNFLDANIFFQLHRSFIVNLNYVHQYKNIGVVVMTDASEIPVSRSQKEEFLKLFDKVSK